MFGAPKKEYVESIADKLVPEPAHCVSVKDEGEFVYYTFRSELREFTFEVLAIKNEGGFGYKERVEYDKAVREYYLKDIMNEVSSCSCFKGRNGSEGNGSFEFSYGSDEDLHAIAKTVAKCNKIVSDQLKYTPEADLTSAKIMNFRMEINRDGASKDDAFFYVLNGVDDEDTVYRKISVH